VIRDAFTFITDMHATTSLSQHDIMLAIIPMSMSDLQDHSPVAIFFKPDFS